MKATYAMWRWRVVWKRLHEYNNEDVSLILYSKATCLYLVVVGKLSLIYTKKCLYH